MKRKRLFRAAAAALMLMAAAVCAAFAEEVVPPSPEPPAANVMGRPTPAPTEVPAATVIDHVHSPGLIPDFSFQKDRKLLEIWFPNIKDADAAVLLYDGEVCLIDCGDARAATRLSLLLKQLGVEKIDVLFNSHLHHDHIDGLAKTDDTAKVGEVRICFAPDLTPSGLKMLEVTAERHIPVKEYRDGDRFTMGDGAVGLLFLKNGEDSLDINNQSAQTMVTYGERSILFMADMERPGQEAMFRRVGAERLKCDIVKYPHHGKSDMYDPFFKAMGAQAAVVTSVEGRKDGGQTALYNRGLPAVYTSVKGMFLRLATDGEYWLIERVPVTEEQ